MLLAATPAPSAAAVDGLVESLKRAWRQGAAPDAAGAMREHPELLRHRSLAVDLAYEEYCLLEEAGSPPDPEQFCGRLPAFRSQVREVIRGHRVLADYPELFAGAEDDWPRPGDTFEGVVLERELGRGGFARVYLARDPAAGDRSVALKLSLQASGEARTLGPIAHPHIVAIHWAKQVRRLHAICMPFVGATTLADVIDATFHRTGTTGGRSGRTILGEIDQAPDAEGCDPPTLTGRESYPDAVAAVAVRLADALAYLHRQGISHGDLKPSNVILGAGAHPYLIDFNLATGLDESLLRCGGTVPYMAPERLRILVGEGEGDVPAGPTDVYSFGVVLFEALTGRLPFELVPHPDPKEVARALLRRQTPAAAGVPGGLSRLLARCLSAHPERRPSAESLARQLRGHLARRTRRRRVLLAACGLLGVGLVAWQVAGATPAPQPQPEPPAARQKPSTADEFFRRGVESMRDNDVAAAMKDFDDARRAKPDGQTTAFLAYCHARSGSHRAAATLYEEAIRDHRYQPPWVHCNRSYSLLRRAEPDQLRQAVAEATAALELDPKLRPARLNRANALFLLELDPKTQTLKAADGCLADLEAVLADGPYTADLYYKAALILAATGREDLRGRAVGYLREAVQLGRDPKLLAQEGVFRMHLADRKDFGEVTALPPAKAPPPGPNPHVIDPLAP